MSVPGGCGVMILRTTGSALATKRWRWNPTLRQWSKRSYEAGAFFLAEEQPVASLAELADVLERIGQDPRAFIVRGALLDAAREQLARVPPRPIRRRKYAKGSMPPMFTETLRRWMMIDIDKWPLPGWADLADDPDTVIDHTIHALLPPEFHDAECWWQLSASAGFAAGMLNCHLFFWLSEPAANAHIKAVLQQHAPGVDCTPFNAVQPHFIAAPVIEGGPDPIPRRTGWRRGTEKVVTLPLLIPNWRPSRPTATDSMVGGFPGSIADVLAKLGHGEGRQGFHAPLRAATLRYARESVRYGGRDDELFIRQLRRAIRSAPRRPDSGVEDHCEEGYLRRLIAGAFHLLLAEPDVEAIPPHCAAVRQGVEHARIDLIRHIREYLDRTLEWHGNPSLEPESQPPEHAALKAAVALGKSSGLRDSLGTWIAKAKAHSLPHRVLVLVQTHKLSGEIFVAMMRLDLNVAVVRGREAEVPGTGNPESNILPDRMCLNLPAVEDALRIGEDVERAACGGRTKGAPKCPNYNDCQYQKQKESARKADIVIATHQFLFQQLPAEVGTKLGLVVVDEAWWQAGVQPDREVRLSGFADEPLQQPVLRDAGLGMVMSLGETNDLHALSAKTEKAFNVTPDGQLVSKEAVLAAGLTAEDCALAAKLEWRREISGAIYPGMPPRARAEAVKKAVGNAVIPRRSAIWKALEELLRGDATQTGRLQMGRKGDAEGAGRVVLLHSRREIREGIAALPILLLDATLPEAVVRHFLPQMRLLADVQAHAPHMRVHQIVGGWGKTSLVPSSNAALEENERRKGRLGQLADFVRLNSGGNALVVTYEAVESYFRGPGVRTGHFNAIAGLDRFRDVRSLFVIGRPLPDPQSVLSLARAVTGRPIAAEAGHTETRGALMEDGTGAAIDVRVYADPDLDAIRAAITDAEVVQAIGRGRGVNRTAETPLDVFVFADVVLPLPVTRLVRWEDIRPNVLERMAARGAVLLSPSDASKAYPDLFLTPDAARMALKRGEEGISRTSPYVGSSLGECSGNRLVEVSYRPPGRGQQNRRALVQAEHLPGFREWLEKMLASPLATFEIAAPPAPARPMPARDTPATHATTATLPDASPSALRPQAVNRRAILAPTHFSCSRA